MTQSSNNYVAAWVERGQGYGVGDKIVVIERDSAGKAHRVAYNPPWYFYVEDPDGEKESIFGDRVTRAEFESRRAYDNALQFFRDARNFPEEGRCPKLFETDIRPINRVLMDYYYGRPTPIVNYAFIDIEANYTRKIGFPSPTNAYAEINAVTIYQSWTKKFITLAIPSKYFDGNVDDVYAEIHSLIEQGELRAGVIPEIILCNNEHELIIKMLELIAEADIVSGWNSEFFDMPYIYERVKRLGDGYLSKLEFPGAPLPEVKMVNKFGTEEPTIKFHGRSHLDYMRLFKKFTFEGRVSYSLGNILQEEVGIGKIEFDGTLEELYNNNFPKFVAYNFRDVDGLVQLDGKFKFIALANQMAHENTVGFESILGTVMYVETGITNHAHKVLDKVVHDKNPVDHDKVEGAVVLTPNIGLHEWIGSVDINSLYPNTIRSLNISPEKIIGQFSEREDAWEEIRRESDKRLAFIFERNHEQMVATAKDFRKMLVENKWAVSAYGTVFDQSNGNGVVADILSYWYSERKRLQAEKKKYAKLAKDEKDPIKKAEYEKQEEHLDLLQLTKKISMNSLYGALLNVAFRFGDERMGASVTASGRQITTHMIETIGYLLTGERKPLIKTKVFDEEEGRYTNTYHSESEAIIYGDTDSQIGSAKLQTSFGPITFESLFHRANHVDILADGREFAKYAKPLSAWSYCPESDAIIMARVKEVYRRRVTKKKYTITLCNGKKTSVTSDHSLMVERKGALVEIKPADLQDGDIFLTAKYTETPSTTVHNGKEENT